MGTSKFFLLGQQNTGATTFKDYVPLSSAPSRPKPGKIRTWIDSLGIFNFLPESGPGYKTIVGSQGDLSAPGGSPRGQNATDLQFDRSNEDQVAAGDRSFIGAGRNNLVVGSDSFIAAGEENTINESFCFASGRNNSVAGPAAQALGTGNLVEGENANATGAYNMALAENSRAEGKNAKTYLQGQLAKSSGSFIEIGDNQYTNVILRGTTTTNVPLELLIDENIPLIIEYLKMNLFRILVVAKTDDNASGAAYELKGLVKKDSSQASTTLVGPVTKTILAESSSAWDVNITVDTSLGTMKIIVTGESDTTIRWAAFVEMVEVQ